MSSSSASSSPLGSTAEPFQLPLSRPASPSERPPSVCGLPLKYVSLVTLAVQNALLTIVMKYSRDTPPEHAYSAAVAVLLNELLKGSISFVIALYRLDKVKPSDYRPGGGLHTSATSAIQSIDQLLSRIRRLGKEIFSADCWKLSIPAILYVIQNNLQYVAASNLDAATFQVTYQMKILTTAAFSVMLLRKKLSGIKWLALFGLAVGVGVVQIQASTANSAPQSAASAIPAAVSSKNPLTGFLAVSAACFTSGLAGVYFEMVLKNSRADLWVRNVQLSLFSLLPALAPIILNSSPSSTWFRELFKNFGFWAWATVSIQVFGGLVTAIVIKYSDNILKGFATSLSIIISFVASVVLFSFPITPAFLLGASIVLGATWLYNQPEPKESAPTATVSTLRPTGSFPGSPIDADDPILGEFPKKKRGSKVNLAALANANPLGIAGMLGLTPSRSTAPETSQQLMQDDKDASAKVFAFGPPRPMAVASSASQEKLDDLGTRRASEHER